MRTIFEQGSFQQFYTMRLDEAMQLKQKGFLTIPGRVSRRCFEEKFYGLRENL